MLPLSDLIEYTLGSQDLNTPSQYLKRYTTPVDITLESGKATWAELLRLSCLKLTNEMKKFSCLRCMRPCNEVFGLMLLIRLRWDQPIERPVPGVQRLSEERWFGSCQTSLNFTPSHYYRFIYYYASFYKPNTWNRLPNWTFVKDLWFQLLVGQKKMRLMKWLNSFSRSCILWGHAHILKIALECQSCPRNFVSWLFVIRCGWFSVTSESLYWKRERATQLLENQSGGISCRVPLSLVRLHRLWCMKLYH